MPERILAVDTCFGACSAAVTLDDSVLAHRHTVMERGHAEALAPMVDEVMRAAGLAFTDLDRLAVTTGPGTFTGQRVGLAFMRGLRVALRRPLLGITSLAAMAEQASNETGIARAAAIHDARREEVYFEIRGGTAKLATFEEALATLEKIGEPIVLAGTGAAKFRNALALAEVFPITAPDAVWVARLALGLRSDGLAPRPLYLRAPDAKLPVQS